MNTRKRGHAEGPGDSPRASAPGSPGLASCFKKRLNLLSPGPAAGAAAGRRDREQHAGQQLASASAGTAAALHAAPEAPPASPLARPLLALKIDSPTPQPTAMQEGSRTPGSCRRRRAAAEFEVRKGGGQAAYHRAPMYTPSTSSVVTRQPLWSRPAPATPAHPPPWRLPTLRAAPAVGTGAGRHG